MEFTYTDEIFYQGVGKLLIMDRESYDENGNITWKNVITSNYDIKIKEGVGLGYGEFGDCDGFTETTDENGRITVETLVVDSFGNAVGLEITDKATGEKIT